MSTVLRVVLDEAPGLGMSASGRSAIDLARALIATAPPDCVVDIVSPAVGDEERDELAATLEGAGELLYSRLPRRELVAVWQRGVSVVPGSGILHSPTAVAPLRRHDRSLDPLSQVSVTIDTLPEWSVGGPLDPRGPRVLAGFLRRAERFADAVVVPVHALADELADALGERVRVIPPGVRSDPPVPEDAEDRRRSLELPSDYVLAPASLSETGGLADLVASAGGAGIALAILDVPPVEGAEDRFAAILPAREGLTRLPALDGADRAAVIAGALAVIDPARATGIPALVLEAMALGVPTVTGPAPALAEITAGASVRFGSTDDPADAILALLADSGMRQRLSTLGRDRARVFTWRDAAEKVWQLHADL